MNYMDFFDDEKHLGFSLEEIKAAEKRLGVLLPRTYRDYLLNYGKDAVNTYQNILMEPQRIASSYERIQEALQYDWEPEFQEAAEQGLEAEYARNPYFQLWKLPVECWDTITEDYILIWYENQGIWYAGYRRKDLLNGISNPPIYISTNDDYITYKKCANNTEEFLAEMLREAAYGRHSGEPSITEYRPKYAPRRLALPADQMQDMGAYSPNSQDGIPLHPLIARLIQETFHHHPATAYDWNKDIARIKTLTIEPRHDTMQITDEKFIFICPSEKQVLPAPYYFDINNWSVIGKMEKLQSLVIHDIYIDDFSFLGTCKSLKRLDLYNTNFSDCRLLSELTNLKEADLRFCPLEYVEALQNLSAKFLMKE